MKCISALLLALQPTRLAKMFTRLNPPQRGHPLLLAGHALSGFLQLPRNSNVAYFCAPRWHCQKHFRLRSLWETINQKKKERNERNEKESQENPKSKARLREIPKQKLPVTDSTFSYCL